MQLVSKAKKIGQPLKVDRNSRLVATLGASLDEFAIDLKAILELKINNK
ncbi:MAG: hypothetical protein ACK5GP_08860 [bacterium]|jgi:hypothetical protein